MGIRVEEVEIDPNNIGKVPFEFFLFEFFDFAAKETDLDLLVGIDSLIEFGIRCGERYKGLKSDEVKESNKNMLVVTDF